MRSRIFCATVGPARQTTTTMTMISLMSGDSMEGV